MPKKKIRIEKEMPGSLKRGKKVTMHLKPKPEKRRDGSSGGEDGSEGKHGDGRQLGQATGLIR